MSVLSSGSSSVDSSAAAVKQYLSCQDSEKSSDKSKRLRLVIDSVDGEKVLVCRQLTWTERAQAICGFGPASFRAVVKFCESKPEILGSKVTTFTDLITEYNGNRTVRKGKKVDEATISSLNEQGASRLQERLNALYEKLKPQSNGDQRKFTAFRADPSNQIHQDIRIPGSSLFKLACQNGTEAVSLYLEVVEIADGKNAAGKKEELFGAVFTHNYTHGNNLEFAEKVVECSRKTLGDAATIAVLLPTPAVADTVFRLLLEGADPARPRTLKVAAEVFKMLSVKGAEGLLKRYCEFLDSKGLSDKVQTISWSILEPRAKEPKQSFKKTGVVAIKAVHIEKIKSSSKSPEAEKLALPHDWQAKLQVELPAGIYKCDSSETRKRLEKNFEKLISANNGESAYSALTDTGADGISLLEIACRQGKDTLRVCLSIVAKQNEPVYLEEVVRDAFQIISRQNLEETPFVASMLLAIAREHLGVEAAAGLLTMGPASMRVYELFLEKRQYNEVANFLNILCKSAKTKGENSYIDSLILAFVVKCPESGDSKLLKAIDPAYSKRVGDAIKEERFRRKTTA